MQWYALGIFAFTYILIAGRRIPLLPIGRPAGALLGATLMVVFGVLSPEETFAAIDHDTLLLLFAMMMLSAFIEAEGGLDALEGLVRVARTPWRLLVGLSLVSALLSAFLVNDTICVFLTPVVIRICQRVKGKDGNSLPMAPYLLALCTSANIGSAATLVGNPQNMIIGSMSHMGFTPFLLRSLPAVVAAMAAQIGLLSLFFRKSLPDEMVWDGSAGESRGFRHSAVLWVTAAIILGFFLGFHMGYTALAGVMALVLVQRKEPKAALSKVDWGLLVFFAGLFIVVSAMSSTGWADRAFDWVGADLRLDSLRGHALFTAVMVAGSNIVSNVPMVLLAGKLVDAMPNPTLAWVELAFVTTVAGNLTLLGSVANLIVAERAREYHEIGFWEYLRFGAVTTLASLLVGVPLLVLTDWMAGW